MLGPALKHLFVDLHERKDPLTKFEQAIHRELLGIMLADHFETSILDVVGTRARGRFIGTGPMVAVEVPGHYLGSTSFRGAMHPMFGGGKNLRVEVDLSGGDWGGSPKLQTACSRPDCPNKEW